MARNIIRESLLCSTDDVCLKLTDAVRWLEDLLERVPAEYREKAVFEIQNERDYDNYSTVWVKAYYDRQETDAEIAERAAILEAERARRAAEKASYAAGKEARDLATYKRLKRKFG